MRERRSFSNDFKRQIVESIVSGSATQAELAREHRISPVMINRWKKDYKKGKFFENVSSQDMAKLELRIRDLERLVGRLTLENEMLKKIRDLDTKEKKDSSSIVTSKDWDRSQRGAR
jgi:transposase-like protein